MRDDQSSCAEIERAQHNLRGIDQTLINAAPVDQLSRNEPVGPIKKHRVERLRPVATNRRLKIRNHTDAGLRLATMRRGAEQSEMALPHGIQHGGSLRVSIDGGQGAAVGTVDD